eukprot:jgi/Botrbrau1/10618/Bobra.154_1s0008.1
MGEFLPFKSPKWQSAGEARRAQAWEAAALACSADRVNVLEWLFEGGWPPSASADAIDAWRLKGILCTLDYMGNSVLGMPKDVILGFEYDLYFHPVRNNTPACLEALLEAGCRSQWLCAIAAEEGEDARLMLAASRGCPCDWRMLKI